MDLVRGVPITKYCDDNRLTPRQRLELFLPVCEAVQHAHQKGVIHRDLKPSNVLVALYDGQPVPKVIDFGVAKAAGQTLTDKTLVTGFGALVGTLEYMSPEQAEVNQLDIDTRSDIYSLGVLLYELLTGSPPFTRTGSEPGGVLEMLRVIREQAPTRPSAKLSTAEGLPTLAANRGTEPARLARLVRGELDWMVMKALEKDRGRRYETANGFAQDVQRYLKSEPVLACPPSAGYRFRKFAQRNRRTLLTAALLGAMLLVVAGVLGWMARHRAVQRGRNAEAVAVLLDHCEDALRADRADQAELAIGAAERRAADGGAEELAGRLASCRADLGLLRTLDAIDTRRQSWTGRTAPDPRPLVARWRAALAEYGVTPAEGRTAEAARRVNGSLVRDRILAVLDVWLVDDPSPDLRAVLREADPDPYRGAVRDAAAAADASAVADLAERPEALEQPARFAALLGQYESVPAERRRAVLESALQTRKGDLDLLMSLGRTYPPNRKEGAGERVRWFQAALAAHPGNLAALNNLGTALLDQGDLAKAIDCYQEAIRIDPEFVTAHANLGFALRQRDRDGALASFRQAIRLDPEFASSHVGMGSVLLDRKELDLALKELREGIRLDPTSAVAHSNLGIALWQKGDADGALASFREAIQLDPESASTHVNLGAVLCTEKRNYDGAITALNEAIRLEPGLAPAHYNLGVALQGKKDLDGAMAAFKEAIRLNPKDVRSHVDLGAILCDVKRDYDGAIACFEAAIRLNPQDAKVHYNLGVALWPKGQLDRAVAAFAEAVRLNPNHAWAHMLLAWLLATGPDGLRDGKQAVAHATRACELTGWNDPGFIETLAAAQAEAGDFDRAAEFQRKALAFPSSEKQSGKAQERLQLYTRNMPYRDSALVRREPGPPPREAKP
jgi:tetratricopeptide (TPR) repeat protein